MNMAQRAKLRGDPQCLTARLQDLDTQNIPGQECTRTAGPAVTQTVAQLLVAEFPVLGVDVVLS